MTQLKFCVIINNIKNVLVIRNPLKSRANVANKTCIITQIPFLFIRKKSLFIHEPKPLR